MCNNEELDIIELESESGELLKYPDPSPVREGYKFTGWYTDASRNTLWNFTTPVTEDMELHAGWAKIPPTPTPVPPTPTPAPPTPTPAPTVTATDSTPTPVPTAAITADEIPSADSSEKVLKIEYYDANGDYIGNDYDAIYNDYINGYINSLPSAAHITGVKDSPKAITLPKTIRGCPVVSVSKNIMNPCVKAISFELWDDLPFDMKYYNNIQTIVLPSGWTSIPEYAFLDCGDLMYVKAHENITSIGSYAFQWCESLQEITDLTGCKTIDEYAFYDSGLTQITIPESMETV